ncbi:MAG: DUF1161 domain-containing protein [Undibacterium sp.]|uniref:DUF1161 domain-containing protein n=1 Tax=Undibacterium sp. TaxID=1914977 RepID=UPI002720D01C|nr:DUF1161 domain-containing protein [Undibacterium sp.]MDO8651825.1 DUF1161 domain-containing protein [Undibacterium sp.]
MKKMIVASSLILMSTTGFAAIISCDELKQKIDTKLEGKSVKHYRLQVAAKDTETKNRVVASCDGGKKIIIYHRLAAPKNGH